jgi:benzylsuccinate CoA-transferase BbsF subunit
MAGQHGPQSRFAGYASMFVALSGLGEMTGYADGPPSQILVGGDVIVGIHGAFSVIAALLHRQRTGRGLHIDLSAIESQSCLIGDSLLDFAVNGSVQRRAGNDEPGAAPHNCYKCRGDDRWVAIAVTSEGEWAAFVEAIGSPPWASEGRFATGDGRYAHRRDLDELVTSWTSDRSADEVTKILQEAGVAAIPSYPAAELFSDPHVADHEMLVRAIGDGGVEVPLVRLGGRLSVTPMSADRAGPAMGEHNDEVFQGLLGLSPEQFDALTAEGVFT